MSGCLIVTPDLSSGGMARQLLKKEGRANATVFACTEDFTVGPLVSTATPEQLLRIRHRFWVRKLGRDMFGLDPIKDRLKQRGSLRQRIMAADQIEVLVGGDGQAQLFLLGFVQFLIDVGAQPSRVKIFQYPSHKPWYSLGMLGLEALADRPSPVALTPEVLGKLAFSWSAVCDNTPHRLFQLQAAENTLSEFPFIPRAYDCLTFSYPNARTGLTQADHRLLTYLSRDWVKAARVIAEAMGGDMNGRSFGDGLLFGRMLEMADGGHGRNAIELRGDGKEMRTCEVRITDFGAACLSGDENLVAANGIDTWVAGVHLCSKSGAVWYRGAHGEVLTA